MTNDDQKPKAKTESETESDELQKLYGCENCHTFTLVYRDGQCSCSTCGTIQKTKLSQEAEYRYYGDSDNKSKPAGPGKLMAGWAGMGGKLTLASAESSRGNQLVSW